MKTLVVVALLLGAASVERPVAGDVAHGDKLLKKAGVDKVRVDGAWLNRYADADLLALLEAGKDGFPEIETDNVLDRWDVLASLRTRNTDLRDLRLGADAVLVVDTKLDDNAQKRLTDQGKLPVASIQNDRRVFALFKLGDDEALTYVNIKDNKKRDALKKDKKVGYVVFLPLPGLRGGGYEAAFAVDKDIRIQQVTIRGPDGSTPADLNQAAQKFVGKGTRGKYDELKSQGGTKATGELSKPLSQAFLMAMEAVYMFEIDEREYFAFD